MNSFLKFGFLILSYFCVLASLGQSFKDAEAFGFRGHVKSVYEGNKCLFAFDENGRIVTYRDGVITDANYTDFRGGTSDRIQSFKVTKGGTFCYECIYYGDNRFIKVLTNSYNDLTLYMNLWYNRFDIKILENELERKGERLKGTSYLYDNYEYDNNGNCIKKDEYEMGIRGRVVDFDIYKEGPLGSNETISRHSEYANYKSTHQYTISYWDSYSQPSKENINKNAENFTYRCGTFTIKELLSCPFGIIKNKSNEIWSITPIELEKEVRLRSNYIIKHRTDYLWSLYYQGDSCISYKGVPITLSSIRSNFSTTKIEGYDYDFTKNITGVIPKYEKYTKNYSSKPNWTLAEANDFYDSIVKEFKEMGIELRTTKNKLGHNRMMVGYDDNCYYELYLHKFVDKYSAFITVSLTVSKRNSRLDRSSLF